jgi:hypothetical protein
VGWNVRIQTAGRRVVPAAVSAAAFREHFLVRTKLEI